MTHHNIKILFVLPPKIATRLPPRTVLRFQVRGQSISKKKKKKNVGKSKLKKKNCDILKF